MRSVVLLVAVSLATLTSVQAMSPSPLGPVSRDLMVAKLMDVKASIDGMDVARAHERMTFLVKMLENDAYWAGSRFVGRARQVLRYLDQDDLASAYVELERLFESFEASSELRLGTA